MAAIDNERGVLARAHLVTAEQRLKNKAQSRYSNTDEGTILFLDVEQGLRQGYPVEQSRSGFIGNMRIGS